MTAPTAQDALVCSECNGKRGFYSDNGPAPRWETCPECDGAGDFDDLGVIERAPVTAVGMGFVRETHTGLVHLNEGMAA